MIIKKKRKTTVIYDVTKVIPFGYWNVLEDRAQELGKSMDKRCIKCNHKFSSDELIYLAIMKKGRNRCFCGNCAQEFWNKEGM